MLEGRALSASLTANDIQASLAWYRDVVGFTVDRNFEREGKLFAVRLTAGEVRILLTQDDGKRGDRVKGEGFSLMITTAQNIDALAAAIKQRGATLDSEPETNRFGIRAFRLRDPDGFRLTISSG